MPHSARSLPPCYRHSRLTIVRRDCWMCRIAEIHGEAMYTAPDCAARAVIQTTDCQCEFSLGGFKGGISLFEKEISLPYSHPRIRRGNLLSAPAQKTLFLFLSLQLRKFFFLQLAIRHLTNQSLGHILLELDVIRHGVLRHIFAAVGHEHLLGLLGRGHALR